MSSRVTLHLLCLFPIVFLSACAAAVVSGGARGGYDNDHASITSSSDAAISSAINARYVRDQQVSAFDVSINTYRGTVTLYGSVDSAQAALRAIELARSVAGVNGVVSRLTVKSK